MDAMDFPNAQLESDCERVVQATRWMEKIHVEVLCGEVAVYVLSRAVKKQVEELLGTLDLQSRFGVYLRRKIPHPPTGPERHFPHGVQGPS